METKIFVWIVMGWYEFVDFYMKFLLELGFEVLKSVITCSEYGILPLSMILVWKYGFLWICLDFV